MRTCTADLVKYWGLDPAAQESRTRKPEPIASPGTWLRPADYPTGALRKGASAVIDFRLMLDAAGQPTDCHIQGMTKGEEFPMLTCKLLMKRARFSPALGADGKPIASYYTNSVRWTMEP